jgi:hypothetical protein
MREQVIYIEYGVKKYPLFIKPVKGDKEWALEVKCEAANLNQHSYVEDIWELIDMIPDLIKMAQEIDKKEDYVRIRLSPKEKWQLEILAKKSGYKNISAYVRARTLQTA